MALLAMHLLAAPTAAPACGPTATSLSADLTRSTITWRGTKFFGARGHEGPVTLASGVVCLDGTTITGGRFVADLRTIDVSDIPAHEPVPRRKLLEHLLADDFFAVARHPLTTLELLEVTPGSTPTHRVRANLTMRGVTHEITFDAEVHELTATSVRASARLVVDRHRWGVRFRGSRLGDDLVDDTFTLQLVLVTRDEGTSPRR
jgi:polyisoprenoid-binding protein YceI